jgi:hypothetical protein
MPREIGCSRVEVPSAYYRVPSDKPPNYDHGLDDFLPRTQLEFNCGRYLKYQFLV